MCNANVGINKTFLIIKFMNLFNSIIQKCQVFKKFRKTYSYLSFLLLHEHERPFSISKIISKDLREHKIRVGIKNSKFQNPF